MPGDLGESGNGGMVSGCAATPGCVAYIGISYLKQTQSKHLGEAEIANARAYELPTATTIQRRSLGDDLADPVERVALHGRRSREGYPIINYEYASSTASSRARTTRRRSRRSSAGH